MGRLYSTGTPSGSRCSSRTCSSDLVRGHSGRWSLQSHLAMSPTATPATPASLPACPSWVSIPSTYQGGASTSSKNRIAPSSSISQGGGGGGGVGCCGGRPAPRGISGAGPERGVGARRHPPQPAGQALDDVGL